MNRGDRALWVAGFGAALLIHAALLARVLPTAPPPSRDAGTGTDAVRIDLGAAPSPAPAPNPSTPLPRPEPAAKSMADARTDSASELEPESEPNPERAPVPEPAPEPDVPRDPPPPEQSRQSKQSEQSTQSAAESRAEAGEPLRGEGHEAARADYLQRLRTWLSRHQVYPRRARLRGLEGEAVITLHFDSDGELLRSEVTEPTGARVLDEALQVMLERAQPLPMPTETAVIGARTINVPIRFSLAQEPGNF